VQLYEGVFKSFRTVRLERELQIVHLSVVSLFCESVCEFCHHNPLCCFSTSVYCCCLFHNRLSPETFCYTHIYIHHVMSTEMFNVRCTR
jgi:hypothetical protein